MYLFQLGTDIIMSFIHNEFYTYTKETIIIITEMS